MSLAFVGRVMQSLKGFYNGINPATLTGAIDVVIVKNPDGTYHSSPFHVRFGKLGVLRSREKVVDIEINGEPIELQMKLGEAGEAFFVQEIESEDENFPDYLATSPLPSSSHLMEKGVEELHRQVFQDSDSTGQVTDRLTVSENMLSIQDPRSDSSWDEFKASGKPRRKVFKKKKQKSAGSRSSPRSMSMPENVSAEEILFELEVTHSSDDDEVHLHHYGSRSSSSPAIKDMDMMLQGTTSHRRISSQGNFVTPYSEPETSPIGSPMWSRPATPKSDTEVDRQHAEENQTSVLMDTSATWPWGKFPTAVETTPVRDEQKVLEENKADTSKGSSGFMSIWRPSTGKKTEIPGGIYLDDLANLEDPEMTKIYLGRPREKEDDTESGRGQSLPQSPNSVEGAVGGPVSFTMSEVRHLGPVALSLCGGLNESEGITLDKFMQKVVTFEDLAENANITLNPDLVVKIHDKYYNWATAGPMVLSQIVFHKQLPEVSPCVFQPVVKSLEKEHMPKKEKKKKGWFSWARSVDVDADLESGVGMSEGISSNPSTVTLTDSLLQKSMVSPSQSPSSTPPGSVTSTPRKHAEKHSGRLHHDENTSTETDTDASEKEASKSPSPPLPTEHPSVQLHDIDLRLSHTAPRAFKARREKYIKTLRLSSEQISKMKLREGHNEICFSVTTQYQGTTRCVAHVYLWNFDDKIVISDIDGTITKSDALGQILPIIGRDWSQSGVAQLFTRIHKNGYKLIYLSARAIGQSRSTKDMLKNIRQGDLVLPDGPLFLNPTSLFSAFHREVILKNPEEFKISCLKDIADLFPCSPFYAGFGNKFNDVIAYRALNIPSYRIFTINPQGQLRHDLSLTFLSSYAGMSDIVDHFFPALDKTDRGTFMEFNDTNYWRDPIPCIDNSELALLSTSSHPSPEPVEKK
ncbi:unnamed protein product [Candidula unifasciata]|uniref:phosphatidate phosphatase n=1 Tax=Candidula unifasciata TaxID=100452 RepID=A0A8S4A425_9EUPU|nr:unnamed protein product [Candidula unifasciata]